jgi:hypothetical protein
MNMFQCAKKWALGGEGRPKHFVETKIKSKNRLLKQPFILFLQCLEHVRCAAIMHGRRLSILKMHM